MAATGTIGRGVDNVNTSTGENDSGTRGTDHDKFDAALRASESATGLDVHLKLLPCSAPLAVQRLGNVSRLNHLAIPRHFDGLKFADVRRSPPVHL
jgi:hypothetical protein